MNTNRRVVMIALMVATFLTAIEGTIVSTAMPKIAGELQGIEVMNWVFSIYLLMSSVTVPIFGKLSDLFGRKIIFYVGTLLFLLGSTLCGLAQSMEQLIWFRALQGIGAGAVMPISSTIIGDIFPVEQRARMFGFIGVIWSVAGILGPLVGGFFVDKLTWHWIFFINIPFGLIAMLMLGFSFKEKIEKTKKQIDYGGALTFSAGMLALLVALQQAGETQAWGSPFVLSLLASAVLVLGLFFWIETKVNEPMIPLKLFRIRTILVSNTVVFLANAVLIGMMVYLPMWLQGVLGYSATASGFVSTPMSLTWTVGAFLCGRLLVKSGARKTFFLGMLFLLAGTIWLSGMGISSPVVFFYLITAIQGIGFGIVTTLSTVTVQSSVDWTLRGAVTASNMFFRTLGQTLGISLFGTYFNAIITADLRNRQGGAGPVTVDQMNQLINPHTAGQLSVEVQNILREVLMSGVQHIYIVLILLLVIGLAISLYLPSPREKEKADAKPAAHLQSGNR